MVAVVAYFMVRTYTRCIKCLSKNRKRLFIVSIKLNDESTIEQPEKNKNGYGSSTLWLLFDMSR